MMNCIPGVNPIIKISENCNFRCRYCYFEKFNENPAHQYMDESLVLSIIKQAVDYNQTHFYNQINICWHGGEPLMYGAKRFEKLLYQVDKLLKESQINYSYSLQTNGYLVSSEWIEIFKKFKINIGVSLDGDENINNIQRGLPGTQVTQRILENIELLKENNLYSGILSVITNLHINRAKEIYEFYIKHDLKSIGLCKCFSPNEPLNTEGIANFLIELFNLWYYSENTLSIREFEVAISNYLNVQHSTCSSRERALCGSFLEFSTSGDVFFCDNFDDYDSIGNIKRSSLNEIIGSNIFESKRSHVLTNYSKMCSNCKVRKICRGGCPRQDIFKNGISTNAFCEINRIFYEHIEKVLQINEISDN